jgi:hypothetical protein
MAALSAGKLCATVFHKAILGFEASVEASEAGQLEYGIVVLLIQPVAPVPGACQSTVDTGTCQLYNYYK